MQFLQISDWCVIVVYLVAIVILGISMGKGQKGARDYFLGGRDIPWWGVGLSILATETSALTFIGVPALAYGGTNLTFIQIVIGYVLARVVLTIWIAPSYFRGEIYSPYALIDQIATDIRLYARDQLDQISETITLVQRNLLDLAERESNTIIPGFTHLQVAQPITFGHHMMAWFEMLNRDFERFQDCRKRLNRSPLGSAALAGTTFPIDRQYTADLLGFDSPIPNSLDAVSDRDFIIEIAAAGSLLMTHLSRFSEEIVLWTSAQFNFIELPDEYCTGSSIMPQKKNPDVPELVRGKSGRVLGHLVSLITLMKSQPLAYNKDNQEDKEPLFDLIDTIKDCLYAYSQIIPAIKCNKISMRLSATKGFSTATDLADYIVKKGLAFRDAHEIVGKTVAYAIREGIDLAEIPLDKLSEFSPLIKDDVFKVLTLEGSVNARNHFGGTAPNQVLTSIETARSNLEIR